MDENRFDDLSRRLATGVSRRGAIKAAAAGLLGALGLRAVDVTGAQVSQVYCGNQACASNPGGCKPGCVCCVYTNAVTGKVINSRCRPPGQCSPGTQVGGPTTTTTTTTAAPAVCTPGSARSCYSGPAGTAGMGLCRAGTETCNAQGSGYGPCAGAVTPTAEICDGLDNDCDGFVDDGPLCPTNLVCLGGQCVCSAGTHLCGGGCVSNFSTQSCGASCAPCPAISNATTTCNGTACGFTCNAGFANCDGNPATGCERNLNFDVNHCGQCGRSCPSNNGAPNCSGGFCSITCTPGYANCNGNPADGCETAVFSNDNFNCGACGNFCGGSCGFLGSFERECHGGFCDCDD